MERKDEEPRNFEFPEGLWKKTEARSKEKNWAKN